jgi:hypothetical protein
VSNPFDTVDPEAAGNPFDAVDPHQAAPQGDASQWGPGQEAVNATSMGIGPKLDEWLGKNAPTWMMGGAQPTTAAQEQSNADAYKQQNPKMALAADMAGGSLPFLATGGATSGLGLGARALAMAGTGAAAGGVPAAMQGQDPTAPALLGAGLGVGGELGGTALTSAGGKLADAIVNRGVNVPSAADLKNIANPQYTALKANPASMSLSEGAQFGQDTLDQLNKQWLGDTKAAKEFSALANPPPPDPGVTRTGVTAGGLETARQNLNAIIRQSPGTAEATAAGVGKQSIDRLVAAKAASDPDWAGFASGAADARGNWAGAKGSDTITGATDKATGRAATNLVDNSPQLISKRAQSLLENQRLTQGLPQDALDQIGDVAHPGTFRKALSSIGAMGGHTGVGLSTAVPIAIIEALQHGLTPETLAVGLGAAGLGVASHAVNTALAKGGMNSAAETVRMASPAFRDAISSGASTAPIDVTPAQIAARKLASAMGASAGQPLLQSQGSQYAPQ